jgi:hypothetical protein
MSIHACQVQTVPAAQPIMQPMGQYQAHQYQPVMQPMVQYPAQAYGQVAYPIFQNNVPAQQLAVGTAVRAGYQGQVMVVSAREANNLTPAQANLKILNEQGQAGIVTIRIPGQAINVNLVDELEARTTALTNAVQNETSNARWAMAKCVAKVVLLIAAMIATGSIVFAASLLSLGAIPAFAGAAYLIGHMAYSVFTVDPNKTHFFQHMAGYSYVQQAKRDVAEKTVARDDAADALANRLDFMQNSYRVSRVIDNLFRAEAQLLQQNGGMMTQEVLDIANARIDLHNKHVAQFQDPRGLLQIVTK